MEIKDHSTKCPFEGVMHWVVTTIASQSTFTVNALQLFVYSSGSQTF